MKSLLVPLAIASLLISASTSAATRHKPKPKPRPSSAQRAIAHPGVQRAPAGVAAAGGRRMGTKDIDEAIKIMGQSRNLSMGLLFQKDKDKLSFGTPRTDYKDKVSDKTTNF